MISMQPLHFACVFIVAIPHMPLLDVYGALFHLFTRLISFLYAEALETNGDPLANENLERPAGSCRGQMES
jgi:hypothetical protein